MSEIHSQFFTSNLTEISRNYPFYCRLNSAGNNFFTKKTDIERRIIQGVFINAQSEIYYSFVETNLFYKFKRNVLKLPCQLKNLFSHPLLTVSLGKNYSNTNPFTEFTWLLFHADLLVEWYVHGQSCHGILCKTLIRWNAVWDIQWIWKHGKGKISQQLYVPLRGISWFCESNQFLILLVFI